MKDDEKTARGPARAVRAPIGRSTAPAGTPSPRGGSPYDAMPATVRRAPSDRPMDTLTPPRTVGGQTARLKIPEADPYAVVALEPVPPSRTVGGTMRLAPALTMEPPIPDVDWDSKPAPAPAPAPPAPMTSTPRGISGGAPTPLAPPLAVTPADDSERVDWLSPLPVAVGLVFFAVGSMVGMTIDGRMRAAARAAQPVASAAPSGSASVIAPVNTATAAPPVPVVTAAVAQQGTATARPVQPPSHPTGASTGAGTKRPGGRPGLPF